MRMSPGTISPMKFMNYQSGDNGAGLITIPADSAESHVIRWIVVSYSSAGTGIFALLLNGVTLFTTKMEDGVSCFLRFPEGLPVQKNGEVSIVASTGGVGVYVSLSVGYQ